MSCHLLWKNQNFEFQHTVLSETEELNEWAMSFHVTKVFCFFKIDVKRVSEIGGRGEQKSQKYQTW